MSFVQASTQHSVFFRELVGGIRLEGIPTRGRALIMIFEFNWRNMHGVLDHKNVSDMLSATHVDVSLSSSLVLNPNQLCSLMFVGALCISLNVSKVGF